MKVTPVASPHQIMPPNSPSTAADARARAIAKLSPQTSQQAAGLNPNAVSPEEMTAIQSPLQQVADQAAEMVEQKGDTETQVETQSADTTTDESQRTTEETEKPKVDPALSRQFAQLARQEKALRAKAQQQEQAIQAREEALRTKEAQIQQLEQQYKSGYISMDKLKTDTLSVLANAGVSYDELTQQILNQSPTDPRVNAHIARLEAQIEELKQSNETTKQATQESQQSAYKAAIKQITADAKQLVYTDPAFETVKALNAVNDVVELIEQTYQKDGVVLSVEEAAQQVEDYYVEEGIKMSNIDKIKKRISQASAPAPKSNQQTQATAANQQTQPTMKTLTNAAASTRKLSAKERAILAFKGELKG